MAVNLKLWEVFLKQIAYCAKGSRLYYRIEGKLCLFIKIDDETVMLVNQFRKTDDKSKDDSYS